MFYRHLTSELWKLFGKKRTYIGFGAFLVAQNVTLLFFRFSRWQQDIARNLEGNGYLVSEYISALTVALIMLLPQVVLLMPLYAALVGGDLVAKEAEDGTLRMILSRPISRFRLLLVKWLAGVIFSAVLVTVLGTMALVFARMWFPWRAMFVFFPPLGIFSLIDVHDGLRLYILSHAFMAINASAILSLAFMFSCFNMKPAAATVLSLSFLFMNLVLETCLSLSATRNICCRTIFVFGSSFFRIRPLGPVLANPCASCSRSISQPSSSEPPLFRREILSRDFPAPNVPKLCPYAGAEHARISNQKGSICKVPSLIYV